MTGYAQTCKKRRKTFTAYNHLGRSIGCLSEAEPDGEADKNATVFDMDGRPKWSFHAGTVSKTFRHPKKAKSGSATSMKACLETQAWAKRG